MKKEITSVIEAFEIGQNYKENKLSDYDFMMDYNSDDTDYKFFMLGFKGATKPIKATGWRYGKFMEMGTSKNFQTGKMEAGVSLMEVFVDGISMNKASTASALFFEGKEVVEVVGYWTPDIWGSDGEPLMLMAQYKK